MRARANRNHTPGPWNIGPRNTITARGLTTYGRPIWGDGESIARVWNGTVGEEMRNLGGRGEANACLIAAAPELAEELAYFVAWAEEHREQAKRAGERPCIDAHRVARARRLLKKARHDFGR
jgi:hypothetical protein